MKNIFTKKSFTMWFAISMVPYFVCEVAGCPMAAVAVCKILPIALLFTGVLTSGRRSVPILLALIFSACGDTAGELDSFIFQIGLFLVAQVFYIIDFARHSKFKAERLPLALFLLTYMLFIAFSIIPNVSPLMMQFATMSYLVIIGTMGMFAIFQNREGYLLFMAGAAFFIFSDSIIAINSFLRPVSSSMWWIMPTYYLAQYFIGINFIGVEKKA